MVQFHSCSVPNWTCASQLYLDSYVCLPSALIRRGFIVSSCSSKATFLTHSMLGGLKACSLGPISSLVPCQPRDGGAQRRAQPLPRGSTSRLTLPAPAGLRCRTELEKSKLIPILLSNTALSAETATFITLIGMIEENWDPVQQEHFITCCTVLQIQLSPAEGLNGPPRVALETLKDYKSTCPEPAAAPLPRPGSITACLSGGWSSLVPAQRSPEKGDSCHWDASHHERGRDASRALPARPHPMLYAPPMPQGATPKLAHLSLQSTRCHLNAKHQEFAPRPGSPDREQCQEQPTAGLCCSLGLLACPATKTFKQSFPRVSLNA